MTAYENKSIQYISFLYCFYLFCCCLFLQYTGFQIEFQVNRSLVLKLTELTGHFVLNLKKFYVNKFVLIVYVMSISTVLYNVGLIYE